MLLDAALVEPADPGQDVVGEVVRGGRAEVAQTRTLVEDGRDARICDVRLGGRDVGLVEPQVVEVVAPVGEGAEADVRDETRRRRVGDVELAEGGTVASEGHE